MNQLKSSLAKPKMKKTVTFILKMLNIYLYYLFIQSEKRIVIDANVRLRVGANVKKILIQRNKQIGIPFMIDNFK